MAHGYSIGEPSVGYPRAISDNMIRTTILKLIRLYQKTLSPDSGWFSYKHPYGFCRFYPHCSEYGYQAIEKHGLIKGGFLIIKRILKCNPFSRGGVDSV